MRCTGYPPLETMKCLCTVAVLSTGTVFANMTASLEMEPPAPGADRPDWLLDSSPYRAGVFRTQRDDELVLSNGLIRRLFRLAPNAATVGFDNLFTGESILRGVKPEARVEIDGVPYDIGGLHGQPNYAYLLPEWVDWYLITE